MTATDQGGGAANNSPMVVADPEDPSFLALANRVDAPDYGCLLHLSGDAGRGWIPARPVSELPPSAEHCYGPEVGFGPQGRLYFLFVGLGGPANHPTGVFLTTSDDDGRTFSTARQVLGPKKFGVRMVVDAESGPRGRIHMVWIDARSEPGPGGFGPPPNPILTAHSDDGGKSFSEPVQVGHHDRARVVAPTVALGPDRAVHVAYYDIGQDDIDYQGLEGPVWDKPWSLIVSSSADGGRSFEPGQVAEAKVMPDERVLLPLTMAPPALVADGRRVCAAWTDGRHGDADVFLRCSENGGRTWLPARRLNDDAVGTGPSQYLPHLALAPDGRLDAVFYDRRADPQNLNSAVSYTSSSDGGRSFSTNLALTTEGLSLTLIGRQYDVPSAAGRFDFGSRLALLAHPQTAFVAWTDTHNSVPPTTAQDIFATVVEVPESPEVPRRRVAGAVLALAGAVAVAASAAFRLTRRTRNRA